MAEEVTQGTDELNMMGAMEAAIRRIVKDELRQAFPLSEDVQAYWIHGSTEEKVNWLLAHAHTDADVPG
jgi:hypothetical protein